VKLCKNSIFDSGGERFYRKKVALTHVTSYYIHYMEVDASLKYWQVWGEMLAIALMDRK
jgi:hypothetical protein